MIVLPTLSRGLSLPGQIRPNLPSQFAVPNGLVGYWGLDPDCLDFTVGKALDLSGNGNTGTLNNITSASLVSGQIGTAINFNGVTGAGESKIVTASIAHNIGTGDFTWAAWVNPSTPSSYQAVCANGSYSPALYTYLGTNVWGFYWSGDKSSGDTFPFGSWQFLVALRRSGVLNFYRNAIKTPSTASVATSMPNAAFTIGEETSVTGTGAELKGPGDEVRFYNRALDPSEIITLYRAGLAGRRDAGSRLGQQFGSPALFPAGASTGDFTVSGAAVYDRFPTTGVVYNYAAITKRTN